MNAYAIFLFLVIAFCIAVLGFVAYVIVKEIIEDSEKS